MLKTKAMRMTQAFMGLVADTATMEKEAFGPCEVSGIPLPIEDSIHLTGVWIIKFS